MAEMTQTLASMRQSIERKVHARDATGPLKSAIDRAINDAYSRIMSFNEWVWSQAEGAMLTYAPLTEADGGVLTPGGASYIRLDAAVPAPIDDVGSGWIVQASTRRSIVSQGTGADDGKLTLALQWPNGDVVTSYALYCIAYNPSSLAIGKVNTVLIEDEGSLTELDFLDTPQFSEEYLDDISPGKPEYYTVLRYSSAGYPLFGLGPIPDEQYQIVFRYYRRPLALVNDTDSPILPPQWHHAIEEGALEDLFGSFFQDQYQANRHSAQFQRTLRAMLAESQATTRSVHYLGGAPPRATNWQERVD